MLKQLQNRSGFTRTKTSGKKERNFQVLFHGLQYLFTVDKIVFAFLCR